MATQEKPKRSKGSTVVFSTVGIMASVRILLGRISPEWNHVLLQVVEADEELEIVGAAEDLVALLMQVEELKADVVVLSQLPDGSEPGICSHLVLEHPNVRVLLLPSCRGPNVPFSVVLRKDWLKDASRETLRSALQAMSKHSHSQ
jgi:DNA-binding NarL/FixJ family response regulator